MVLPAPVIDYLSRLAIERRSLAYLRVSHDERIESSGGNLAAFGLEDLSPQIPACVQADFLVGLLPARGDVLSLPYVEVAPGHFAELHIFPGEAADWVVLLSAREEVARHRDLQQKANDLSLLRERHWQGLARQVGAQPESGDADTTAVLQLAAGGERCPVAVLQAGLRGWEAEGQTAALVQSVAATQRLLARPVLDQAGILYRSLGGRLTGVFGLLPSRSAPGELALRAAARMGRSAAGAGVRPTLDIAIGIAAGEAAVGLVGGRGFESLHVVGESVGLAVELERRAGAGEILLNRRAMQEAKGVSGSFRPGEPVRDEAIYLWSGP